MEALKVSSDVLFILLGAIMVLAMHAGFAFLELGTVRSKNQVNALVKILCDFALSTVAYFFVGYAVAYGVNFFAGAEQLAQKSGYDLVKFFFLLTFAAAIPAIVSGGIAERAAPRDPSKGRERPLIVEDPGVRQHRPDFLADDPQESLREAMRLMSVVKHGLVERAALGMEVRR